MTRNGTPDEAEILEYANSLSNWGRWGPDDELGTVNHLGPEQRRRAASLVRDGVVVSCARPITTELAVDVRNPFIHYMTGSGGGICRNPSGRPA